MAGDRRHAQALSGLERSQLTQIEEILAKAEDFAQRSRNLGSVAPADEGWRAAGKELKEALNRGEGLRDDLRAALKLQSLASLPVGQRPSEWIGPTPAELFDMTTSWDQLYPIKWWQFEHLVAETFRRLGFEDVQVVEGGRSGDGGIDVRMRYGEAPCIVQVKHRAADEFVLIDQLRALAHGAESEQATAYMVTSGKVGMTARREMAKVSPPVFVVDGQCLWTWMEKARGRNSEEVFYPGMTPKIHAILVDSPRVSSDATAKAGCLSIFAICAALIPTIALGALHLVS